MTNLLLFLCVITGLVAQGSDRSFTYTIAYLYDSEEVISKQEVTTRDFLPFPSNEHFGLNSGSYWFRIVITNNKRSDQNYILQIPTHNIGPVALHVQQGGSVNLVDGNSESTLPGRFPTFQLSIAGNTTSTFWLKTIFHKDTNFPVKIVTEQSFYPLVRTHTMWSGLYYGFLIGVVIFNLFFLYKFRDPVYLFYVVFLVSYTIAMLYYDGIMRLLSLPDLEAPAHLVVEITMFLFSFHFLNLRERLPNLKKYAIALAGLMAAFEIIYLISDTYLFFALADVTAMCSFFFMWVVGICIYRKVTYSPFYVVGYLILIICGYYYVLSYNFGLFNIDARTSFFKLASTIDMLVFTYAIIYRMDMMNRENVKMIRELKAFLRTYQTSPGLIKREAKDPFHQLLKENALSTQPLTQREIEVSQCIYQGMSNSQISEKLFVSKNTVKYHVRNIYTKLNVRSREETSDKLNIMVRSAPETSFEER